MPFTTIPGTDENNLFPELVMQAIAASADIQQAISAAIAGKLDAASAAQLYAAITTPNGVKTLDPAIVAAQFAAITTPNGVKTLDPAIAAAQFATITTPNGVKTLDPNITATQFQASSTDTGWLALGIPTPATYKTDASIPIMGRRVGNRLYLKGALDMVTGNFPALTIISGIATLPAALNTPLIQNAPRLTAYGGNGDMIGEWLVQNGGSVGSGTLDLRTPSIPSGSSGTSYFGIGANMVIVD